MIRCQIAIQQMTVHPIGSDTPMHFAQMNCVTSEPHARMIMQIACLIERMYRAVDHGQTGAAFADIVGKRVAVLNARQRRAHVAKNRIASAMPDMMKKFTPAKFESELVFKRQLG